jgi:hypothetical protein
VTRDRKNARFGIPAVSPAKTSDAYANSPSELRGFAYYANTWLRTDEDPKLRLENRWLSGETGQ